MNTLEFNYDAASQLLDASDDNSAYAYTYDQLGRRTSTDNFGTPGTPNVVLTSAYDALGNRTSLSATIDGNADFENTYTYDALSRMSSVAQSGIGILPVTDKRVDFSYNAFGQFTSIDRYEDLTATNLVVSSTYAYDTLGRLTNLTHAGAVAGSPDPATLAFYTWTYDGAHRLTQVSSIDGTTDYSYDATGQLIGADYEAGAGLPTAPPDEAYTYDANGNRVMGDYVIGTNNLVLSDGTYDYQYDAENNLIKKTESATGDYIDYSWDHGGRMTSVEYRDSAGTLTKRVNYTYDVFNRRIGKQVDNNGDGTIDRAERYVYDDSGKFDPGTGVPLHDIVLVFDDTGSLTNRYLHGPAIDQVLADEQLVDDVVNEVLWSLPDHLGTVRDWAAYDAALSETTVTNHLTFDSFGAITSQTDPDAEPLYAFTGREWDADAQLYYYRARWYTPALGRFVSDDPIGFAGGDVNTRRYVGNMSTFRSDPSGLRDPNVWLHGKDPWEHKWPELRANLPPMQSSKAEHKAKGDYDDRFRRAALSNGVPPNVADIIIDTANNTPMPRPHIGDLVPGAKHNLCEQWADTFERNLITNLNDSGFKDGLVGASGGGMGAQEKVVFEIDKIGRNPDHVLIRVTLKNGSVWYFDNGTLAKQKDQNGHIAPSANIPNNWNEY